MFKSGDKIRCIDNKGNDDLELNKIYTFDCYFNNKCLCIKETKNRSYLCYRFKLVKRIKKTSLNNEIVCNRIFNRVKKINYKNLEFTNNIHAGFKEGSGYYIEFPYNRYTRMMIKRKYYINTKTYSEINYLLNRYEELIKKEK